MGLSCFRAISGMGMGWDLCAGLFYEHRFAMLINTIYDDDWVLLMAGAAVGSNVFRRRNFTSELMSLSVGWE